AEAGRLPSEDEHRDGGPLTAVVSHAFWAARMGSSPAAIGTTIRFAQRVFTVVGVLPPEFRFPAGTDVWTASWAFPETTPPSAHNDQAIGRLKPGVSLARAQAEMDTIAGRLEEAYPKTNAGKGVSVDRVLDQMVRGVRTTLTLMFGVVVVVLLIAC